MYLEKPGAPTVAELEEMRAYAKSKGVPVYMGYNKNVTPYVRLALDAARRVNGPTTTTYVHNNAYKTEELPECFERNAEGMLKNMVRDARMRRGRSARQCVHGPSPRLQIDVMCTDIRDVDASH